MIGTVVAHLIDYPLIPLIQMDLKSYARKILFLECFSIKLCNYDSFQIYLLVYGTVSLVHGQKFQRLLTTCLFTNVGISCPCVVRLKYTLDKQQLDLVNCLLDIFLVLLPDYKIT